MTAAVAALALHVLAQERVPSLTGDIRTIEAFRSKALGNERAVWVYLPPGYDRPRNAARYPVLYMHDGQNVFNGLTSYLPNQEWGADEAAQAMVQAGLCRPVIIVAAANAGLARADEYLPTRAQAGSNEVGGKADLYARFLCDELKPYIDKEYRTLTGPEDTAVCGSSFGGILSLHLALSRPDVFGTAGVVSPSVWWDGRIMVKRVQALAERPKVRLWVDMGTDESASAIADSRALRRAIEAKGWKNGEDFVYAEFPRARHNEQAWRERFGLLLAWMFPPRPSG